MAGALEGLGDALMVEVMGDALPAVPLPAVPLPVVPHAARRRLTATT